MSETRRRDSPASGKHGIDVNGAFILRRYNRQMANQDEATGTVERVWTVLSVCEITLLVAFLVVLVFFRSSRYAVTAFALIAALSILITIVDIALRRRFRRR